MFLVLFLSQQKPAYELRISDWSSDVCSSGLRIEHITVGGEHRVERLRSGIGDGDAAHRHHRLRRLERGVGEDRKSGEEGTSGSVRVDPGGRSDIQQKMQTGQLYE